jgi:cytochrome P450
LFGGLLTAKICDSYSAIQEREAVATIHDILLQPEGISDHIHRYTLSVARSVAYGRRVPHSEDPFAHEIKQIMVNFSNAMTSGRYLVESIPILRYLPESLQPWMTELGAIRDFELSSNLRNFKVALADAEKNPDRPSVANDIQKAQRESGEIDERQAATTCNEILGAGSETTASQLLAMIMGCVAFPEVVKKAHEELDRVIGRNRLPTWQDEESLPYIRAIVKEQHRWRTIAPLGKLYQSVEPSK